MDNSTFLTKYQGVIDLLTSGRILQEEFSHIISELGNDTSLIVSNWKKYKVSALFDWKHEKSIQKFKQNKVFNENQYRSYKNRNNIDKYDTSGIYAFWIENEIVYIGRSHRIVARLQDHVGCGSRNKSSFGHGIACEIYKVNNPNKKLPKDILKEDEEYRRIVRDFIKQCEVSFYYVSPLDEERLYLLELYLSMKHRVYLNKFKPH